jgi:hypothetical protein
MSAGKIGFSLLGPLASFALKYPKTAAAAAGSAGAVANATTALTTALTTATKTAANFNPVTFFMAHWKGILLTVGVIAACVSAFIYVKHVESTSYAAGVKSGGAQAVALEQKANAVAAKDNQQLAVLQKKYNALSTTRQQQVQIVTQTKIERIHDEVQTTPVYSQCSITDGVFNDLKATAAAVNASLGASAK